MALKIIPYILNGVENTNIDYNDLNLCKVSIDLMKKECATDRLADNYTRWLKLHEMSMYCIVWDTTKDKPVMASGAQHMSKNCCRLFSRYYLFDTYRTNHTKNLYDKVDDFKTDLYMYEQLKKQYKLFFWSRDKGTGFFKRIKNARPDVFSNWTVYEHPVEILWKDNIQGIIYTGDINYITELAVNK